MQRPKYLYRFRSLADETQASRVRQILVDHQIYISSAASFNDPFDCSPRLDDSATEAEYLQYWTRVLPATAEGRAVAAYRAKGLANRDPELVQSSVHSLELVRYALLNNVGILCMNVDPLHQLMWAHYGDSHRGICIQFHGQHLCFEGAEPVRYLSARPTMNSFTQSPDELVTVALRTKSVVWSYEGEWRTVNSEHVGHVPLPRDAIAGVVIGARATPQTVEVVNQWCAQNTPPIPTYQARLQEGSYDIEVPKLPL